MADFNGTPGNGSTTETAYAGHLNGGLGNNTLPGLGGSDFFIGAMASPARWRKCRNAWSRVLAGLTTGLMTATSAVAAPDPTEPFPYRIGVLADSQITSSQGTFDYGMRSKRADGVSNVAIRPPALEYLAPLMLRRFLQRMKLEKVDLILYLGDGANSGCRDELDTFFGELERARDREGGPPSFFVLGNHDYLGTGNQARMEYRKKLCAADGVDNPPETKEQVLERMKRHNMKSAAIEGSKFTLATETVVSKHPQSEGCTGDDRGQYTHTQVGVLQSKTGVPVDILLADSSDYRDVMFQAFFGKDCEAIGVWGVKGSMSFSDGPSQITVLEKLANPEAKYRFVASHYWPHNMNMAIPFNLSGSWLRDAMVRLIAPGQENVWIGGHTHRDHPKASSFNVGKTLSGPRGVFNAINVGSTTDFHPHGLILAAYDAKTGHRINKTSLGFTVVDYYSDEGASCEPVFALADKLAGELQPVCTQKAVSVLGMDRNYRLSCFTRESVSVVRKNIDDFTLAATATLGVPPDEVKACLAWRGSRNERLGTNAAPRLRTVSQDLYGN